MPAVSRNAGKVPPPAQGFVRQAVEEAMKSKANSNCPPDVDVPLFPPSSTVKGEENELGRASHARPAEIEVRPPLAPRPTDSLTSPPPFSAERSRSARRAKPSPDVQRGRLSNGFRSAADVAAENLKRNRNGGMGGSRDNSSSHVRGRGRGQDQRQAYGRAQGQGQHMGRYTARERAQEGRMRKRKFVAPRAIGEGSDGRRPHGETQVKSSWTRQLRGRGGGVGVGGIGVGYRAPSLGLQAAEEMHRGESPSSNVEDEEVHDRLKGLDPALVEQIESEILMAGKRVMWKDIAGPNTKRTCRKSSSCRYPSTGLRQLPRPATLWAPGTGKCISLYIFVPAVKVSLSLYKPISSPHLTTQSASHFYTYILM